MRIDIVDRKLVIEGKGPKFLHFKAAINRAISAENIKFERAGCISISLDRVNSIASLLSGEDIECSDELRGLLSLNSDLTSRHMEARDKINRLLESNICSTGDLEWDSVLDPKQGVAVNAMTTSGLQGICLFDEQGAGKTVMTIAAFDLLFRQRTISSLIIVCPKTMLSEWLAEFERFLPHKYKVMIVDGNIADRYRKLLRDVDVFVMNYETVDKLLVTIRGVCEVKRTAMVVDESFLIKNPDAKRSHAIRELRASCVKAFVLCGTPAPNVPDDIIHQFDIADNGFTFSGFSVPDDPQSAKIAIMQRISERGVYLRRLKQEMLPDLPIKQFTLELVQMGGKQLDLYEKSRREMVLFLKSLDNRSFRRNIATYLQKRAVLLQICTCPRLIDPLYDQDPVKYSELERIVQKIIDQKRKVVIWSFYRGSLDDIEIRFKKYGIVRIDGTVTDSGLRGRAVKMFQNDPQIKLFIGNPAAAGAGLTLHSASEAIYVSFSNQAAHYLQSLDRIHRRGQLASFVTYHLIVCKGTIEEKEIIRLRDKERQQQELLGDQVAWPSSLDEALSDLE